MNHLGAQRILPLGLGDEDVTASKHGAIELDFEFWTNDLLKVIASWPIILTNSDHKEQKIQVINN